MLRGPKHSEIGVVVPEEEEEEEVTILIYIQRLKL
jgi:hypothetical protein